jgi:hypothetical protein
VRPSHLCRTFVHLPDRDAAGGPCPGASLTGVTMPVPDRRLASRVEIVGRQWGILDALEPLRVCNLSAEGMLIESPNPLAVGSIHEFQLIEGATSVRVRAAVRHLSPLRLPSAERYFLVGLEFLSLDARSTAGIERWLNGQSAQAVPGGA